MHCGSRVSPVPNYPTHNYLSRLPSPPNRPPPGIMTTLEPQAVCDTLLDADHSATIAVLIAGVESITALKDSVETTSVKAIFESVIVILTLVRVRMLVLLPFLRSLIDGTFRTKYIKIRWWNWPKTVSERSKSKI